MSRNSSTNKEIPQASELFKKTDIRFTPPVQHQQEQTETESALCALLCISPVQWCR